MHRLVLVSAVAAALAMPATAAAAPVKIMGKITAAPSHPAKTDPVHLTYHGSLPTLHRREYMWFSMAGPAPRGECNPLGIGTSGSVTRRRMKTDTMDPGIGMAFSGQPKWCGGKWLVQYQVMTPYRTNGQRAWKPRLIIAYKKLTIG